MGGDERKNGAFGGVWLATSISTSCLPSIKYYPVGAGTLENKINFEPTFFFFFLKSYERFLPYLGMTNVGAPANNNDRERVGVAFRVTQQNEQNRNEQAP